MKTLQIKQNAKEIAKEAIIRKKGWYTPDNILFEDAYIAGAHSRDEEIEELKEEIESLQGQYKTCFDGFKKRGRKLGELMEENVKLRNPWISVEDRLPKDEEEVIISTKRGWVFLANRFSNQWCGSAVREFHLSNSVITHWMPIPELPKGGEEC